MHLRTLAFLPLLVTVACYSHESVGVSARPETNDHASPAKAKFPSKIVGQAGESLEVVSPVAGDVDGDGLDDFFVLGVSVQAQGDVIALPRLYLFYGKPEFPAELSTADAEAAFEVDANYSGAAGDLNGDGYDDLMLTQFNAANFIFGKRERYHGLIERSTGGVMWTVGALPKPFAQDQLISLQLEPAGDVNGDGCADLIVKASAAVDLDTYASVEWVIPGFKGEWQPSEFDASTAMATVGYGEPLYQVTLEPAQELLSPTPVGDLDGDGRGDLVSQSGASSLVFYGSPDFSQELTDSTAGAKFLPPVSTPQNADEFFGKPTLWATSFGDLDADGKSDLALSGRTDVFDLAYGKRFAGESRLEADLSITTEPQRRIVGSATGDIDGDGFPELIFSLMKVPEDETTTPGLAPTSGVYVLRGTGERLRGKIKLSENDRWDLPVPQPDGKSYFSLYLAGDIDGDGSQDILTGATPADPLATPGGVYLIPSTPRAPD